MPELYKVHLYGKAGVSTAYGRTLVETKEGTETISQKLKWRTDFRKHLQVD
jgi:hypothetical protein